LRKKRLDSKEKGGGENKKKKAHCRKWETQRFGKKLGKKIWQRGGRQGKGGRWMGVGGGGRRG